MVSVDELHAAYMRSTGACTDTRQIGRGAMFFALKGPHYNANTFAAKALDEACAFAVVDDPSVVEDERYLLVPDVLNALQDLARVHRRIHAIPVIAITGTNGKTTTKELVHAVLREDRPTLATEGNLNNHIGVPLTLLRLTHEHRVAIVEMGANHVGDIRELMTIAEPTHGLITNIGRAHLEGFGGYEGVVKAKTELYDHIWANSGTLFVNADDPLLMEKSHGVKRITYGSAEACNTQGEWEDVGDAFLQVYFRDREHLGRHHVETQLIGTYNTSNVLCAACIGQHFGVPDEAIAIALGEYAPSNNRSQFTDTDRNQVVLDAYNANPSSMKAALENFAAMRSERPKLVILGGMKELGSESRAEHETVVALVQELGLEAILVGTEFIELERSDIRTYASAAEALRALTSSPITGHLVLVKGSRGTRLEMLTPAL